MPKHWIMRAKYVDPATGEVLYSPSTKSFTAATGRALVRRGDWVKVEEIEAEGRDLGGISRGWVPRDAVPEDRLPKAKKQTAGKE